MITKIMLQNREDDSMWHVHDKIMFDLALYVDNSYYAIHLETKEEKQYELINQLYLLESLFGKKETQQISNFILTDFDKAEAELKNIMDMYREVKHGKDYEKQGMLNRVDLC